MVVCFRRCGSKNHLDQSRRRHGTEILGGTSSQIKVTRYSNSLLSQTSSIISPYAASAIVRVGFGSTLPWKILPKPDHATPDEWYTTGWGVEVWRKAVAHIGDKYSMAR
jgi:hypothetical protein